MFAKVSGLYPPDPAWTAEDLRDVVEFAFELFGPDRLMFGSDWPVAELGGGYAKMRAELAKLVDWLSAGRPGRHPGRHRHPLLRASVPGLGPTGR